MVSKILAILTSSLAAKALVFITFGIYLTGAHIGITCEKTHLGLLRYNIFYLI